MTVNPILLSALPEQPSLLENVIFIAIGFFAVLIVLGILALLTGILGSLFRLLDKEAALGENNSQNTDQSTSELKTAAIVSAAIDTAIDQRYHIRSVK